MKDSVFSDVFLLALVVASCWGTGSASAAAQAPAALEPKTIRLNEITPGMQAWGVTVVKGCEPERFEAEVIGILHDIAPGRDAILVKMSGLDLGESGVVAGMSGSPVYIDGRLAGAVAFGWGWPKEPIAGVTPIDEMQNAAAGEPPHAKTAPLGGALNLAGILERRRGVDPQPQGLCRFSSGDAQGARPRSSDPGLAAPAIPLVMPFLSPQARRIAREIFPPERFVLAEGTAAGEGPAPQEADAPLRPGSTVIAGLVSGDMFTGAIGTVTAVEGDRVYAFGHPFLDIEDACYPMYTATVHTIFPSTYRSFKIASPVSEVGAFTRDRLAGVFGSIGRKARTFPVRVSLQRDGETTTYNYRIYRHHAITPELVALSAAASITAQGDLPAETTLSWRFAADYAGGRHFDVNLQAAGAQAVNTLASDVASVLLATMYNPLEYLEPEAVTLAVKVESGNRAARIESVTLRENEVYAGDTLNVLVEIAPVLCAPVKVPIEVRVPLGLAPGRRVLVICDGTTSDLLDLKQASHRLHPATIDALLSVLEPHQDAGTLVARLTASGYGLAQGAAELPDLPPSALAVLASPQVTSLSPLYSSVLTTAHTDFVLSGTRTVPLMIKAPLEKK
ncbi:MAG: hypothetical protein J7M19_09760 [Planctomycetes bacterium]|nr:hypothetical protein [Planctomycetota bacterium]